jgi:pimeloyl-ACP methyl ester carboxylesterase
MIVTNINWSVGLGLALLLSQPACVLATPQHVEQVSDEIGRAYAEPHQLVDVDEGRRLNLYCIGNGKVPVVFSSGLSDGSSIWALVQPTVGEHTRACAYDRAGMGYSDPAHRPSTPMAAVDDLHELLHRAGVTLPVVLVGHSLGGLYTKLYAAVYPADVAGVVLVDPAEERNYVRSAAGLAAKLGKVPALRYQLQYQTGFGDITATWAECVAAAKSHDLDPTSAMYKNCADPAWPIMGPVIAAARESIQVKYSYQAAQASELANSPYLDRGSDDTYQSLFAGAHPFGDLPLIVLSRGIYSEKSDESVGKYFEDLTLHEQTAAQSTRGTNRVVPNTHHNIEIDDPGAVIHAIDEVLDALHVREESHPGN